MSLKKKLSQGEVALMINPDHPSPSLTDFIAGLGCDAIFIDCEHGMASPERVQEMCRAARVHGIDSIVRPESNEDWLVTRYLDAGATGIMVPLIETAEQAQKFVDAVKNARSNDFDLVTKIVMLESKRALENLPEILSVQGVDVFFIGPSDLAKSLGMPGQKFNSEVKKHVFEAAQMIISRGFYAGTAVNKTIAKEYADAGFRLLYEHANAFLRSGADDFQKIISKK